MPLEPGQMLSHYRLDERVWEGGLWSVYRAKDLSREAAVALKVNRPINPEVRARVLRRAERTLRLQHPNILQTLEISEAGDCVLQAMEWAGWTSLQALLQDHAVSLRDAIQYATQIAAGLAAAHESGVLHRNLKPSKVLVGDDSVARVYDFGMADGTIAYMPPEHHDPEALDARSDIFSFGITLFEMVTGEPLYREGIPPVAEEELGPGIPQELKAVIVRCLRKDPAERYPDVKMLLECLRAVEG